MHLHGGAPRDGGDFEVVPPLQLRQIDNGPLRTLAVWIARRRGVDPEIGAPIDRDFVVAQAHD